jgi:class 3 adenylate cyclase
VEAERRQVTVLFTDMVGFTTFSEGAGEEAALALMRSLSELMNQAARERRSVLQGFTGDGMMAVFGFADQGHRAAKSLSVQSFALGQHGPKERSAVDAASLSGANAN